MLWYPKSSTSSRPWSQYFFFLFSTTSLIFLAPYLSSWILSSIIGLISKSISILIGLSQMASFIPSFKSGILILISLYSIDCTPTRPILEGFLNFSHFLHYLIHSFDKIYLFHLKNLFLIQTTLSVSMTTTLHISLTYLSAAIFYQICHNDLFRI